MTERKFTDEEVIEALECRMPHDKVCIEAYDLINRQKAEIDILVRKHDTLLDEIAEKDAEIKSLTKALYELKLEAEMVYKQRDALKNQVNHLTNT